MAIKTCPHGLVGQKKFGTDSRDGLIFCRRCGLPTPDSVGEQQWERLRDAASARSVDDASAISSVDQHTQAAFEDITQRLQAIQVSLIIIGGIVLLGLVAPLWFGWIEIRPK